MFWKLIILIIALTLIGATRLALRQQRYEAGHQIVVTHRQIDKTWLQLTDLRTRMAAFESPMQIEQGANQNRLALEPLIPMDQPQARPTNRDTSLARGRTTTSRRH